MLVEDRAAAVAGADRGGHLNDVVFGAGDDAGAEREAEPFRVADDEDRLALGDVGGAGDGFDEGSLPRLTRNPQQDQIEILMAGYDFAGAPGAGGHRDQGARGALGHFPAGAVEDVAGGDEQVSLSVGLEQHAGAETSR